MECTPESGRCHSVYSVFHALPVSLLFHLHPGLEFVELLRSPGIDSQPGEPVCKPYLMYRPTWPHRLAESIPGLLKRLQIRVQVLLIVFHLVVSIIQCLLKGKISFFFLLFTSQQNRIRILPTNDIPIAL